MSEIGVVKGRLTVIGEGYIVNGKPKLLVKCCCPKQTEKMVSRADFRIGKIVSCGCQRAETKTTHGQSKTKLYGVWQRMSGRAAPGGGTS